jgi:hypothetical protein
MTVDGVHGPIMRDGHPSAPHGAITLDTCAGTPVACAHLGRRHPGHHVRPGLEPRTVPSRCPTEPPAE